MSSWDNAFTGKPKTGMVGSHSFGGAGSFFRTPYSRDLSNVDVAVSGVPLLPPPTAPAPGWVRAPFAMRRCPSHGSVRGRGRRTRSARWL